MKVLIMFFRTLSLVSPRGGGGGEGYSWEFLVGVCSPVLQILTVFQTKNVIFHTRFQTRPLFRQSANKKILDIHLELAYFSFLDSSFSSGFETINTFIHSRQEPITPLHRRSMEVRRSGLWAPAPCSRAKNGEVNGNACDAG